MVENLMLQFLFHSALKICSCAKLIWICKYFIVVQVEGLMMDIAAAEEEITRWKVAAQQEAEAGKGVEQEYIAQVCSH